MKIKDWEKVFVPLLFLGSWLLRMKYAFINGLWVDEGRYALIGRALLEHPLSYSTKIHGVVKQFPPLLPFLLFLSQLVFGPGDFAVRLVNPLLGSLSVLATYYLARKLYGKEIAVIASLLMAVAPYNLFFSERVLLEIPHLLFFTLTIAFFYVGWEEKSEKHLYLASIALALGTLTKQPALLAVPAILTYLLIFYRLSWIKDWRLWKAFGFFILLMLPWSIRSFLVCGKPSCEASWAAQWFIAHEKGGLDVVFDYFYYIKLLPWILNKFILIFFIIGLLYFSKYRKQHALMLSWFIWVLFVFSITPVKVPRYVISIIAPAIVVASAGIWELSREFAKGWERIAIAALFLLAGMYMSYSQGVAMIKAKAPGFAKLKDAGLFFEPMPDNIVILSATPTIIAFYSGDKLVVPYPKEKGEFASYLLEKNVSYVVLDAYERTQPGWTFEFVPYQPYLKPVKVFYQNNQPVVAIFEVNRSALERFLEGSLGNSTNS